MVHGGGDWRTQIAALVKGDTPRGLVCVLLASAYS